MTYAPGSLAARQFIDKKHLSNPSIFPGKDVVAKSFVMPSMDAKTQRLTTRLWQEFKTGK